MFRKIYFLQTCRDSHSKILSSRKFQQSIRRQEKENKQMLLRLSSLDSLKQYAEAWTWLIRGNQYNSSPPHKRQSIQLFPSSQEAINTTTPLLTRGNQYNYSPPHNRQSIQLFPSSQQAINTTIPLLTRGNQYNYSPPHKRQSIQLFPSSQEAINATIPLLNCGKKTSKK